MLIEILLNIVLAFLRVVLLPLQIDNIPQDVLTIFATLTGYLIDGARVVCAYIHVTYFALLLGIVIAVNTLINGYRFLMWVLRKIPFFGID